MESERRLKNVNKRYLHHLFIFIFIEIVGLTGFYSLGISGNPWNAKYSADNSNIFWFIQISDIHIGRPGEEDNRNLQWIVRGLVRQTINPEFIVATGDLTDSTNGATIPNGPHIEEWQEYFRALGLCLNENCSSINETLLNHYKNSYYDIPGNHDHYGDRDFSFYLNWSVQGRSSNQESPIEERTQPSWLISKPFGTYHFIGVNTAGDDGAHHSLLMWENYGDNAGIRGENQEGRPNELQYIINKLMMNHSANLTFLFGHHPIKRFYTSILDTGFSYGAKEFVSLLKEYGVSIFGFGHTHKNVEAIFSENSDWKGVFYLNVASLGKPDPKNYYYHIIAVDNDGVSTVSAHYNQWPVILITTPLDKKLGGENPYAYKISSSKPNPIRALIFDHNLVTKVKFRYKRDKLLALWHNIPHTNVRKVRSVNNGNSYLWEAEWDSQSLKTGDYVIEVVAKSQSGKSKDKITVELQKDLDIISGRMPQGGHDH